MSRFHVFPCAAFLALLCSLPAQAVVLRTFVASNGSDANPCTRTSPCRTFGTAIAAVDSGGEVIVLDAGGYGPVNIIKAVSLLSPEGVYAGVTATAGDGITLSAPANSHIVLRGLNLKGMGGNTGIVVANPDLRVHIEKTVIDGFGADGILLNQPGAYFILDTVIRGNGGNGIFIAGNASKPAVASIDHVRSEENANGFTMFDWCRVTIRDSIAVWNTQVGIGAKCNLPPTFSAVAAPNEPIAPNVSVENCLTAHNAYGIAANLGINEAGNVPFTTVRVSNTTITANLIQGVIAGYHGTTFSYHNNMLGGNIGADGVFTITGAML